MYTAVIIINKFPMHSQHVKFPTHFLNWNNISVIEILWNPTVIEHINSFHIPYLGWKKKQTGFTAKWNISLNLSTLNFPSFNLNETRKTHKGEILHRTFYHVYICLRPKSLNLCFTGTSKNQVINKNMIS